MKNTIIFSLFLGLLSIALQAQVTSTTLTIPNGKKTACEHPWTVRYLAYSPGAIVPRSMYFSSYDIDASNSGMNISLTVSNDGDVTTNAMLLKAKFNKTTGQFDSNWLDSRMFTDFREAHGTATSANGNTIGMLVRRPKGTDTPGSYDKDVLIGHPWADWMTAENDTECLDKQILDQIWLMEWNGGNIQSTPKKYIVHKSFGSWEYGSNYLLYGENDNSYGIALKTAKIAWVNCSTHESDSYLILDRSDYSLTRRCWNWAIGVGHTMSNFPAYNPNTRQYAMLGSTDYNDIGLSKVGSILFRNENGKSQAVTYFNRKGIDNKGGAHTLLPDGDGFIGVFLACKGTIQSLESIPLEPATALGVARFNQQGQMVGEISWLVDRPNTYIGYPQLAKLDNGKFLVGYGEMFDLNDPDVEKRKVPRDFYLMEFDANLNPLTFPMALDGIGWGEIDRMISLGDGYVAWAYIPNPKMTDGAASVGPCDSNVLKLAAYKSQTPDIIIIHPESQEGATGKTVTFSVTARGNNITYQWKKNDENINGANQATYSTPALALSDNNAVFTCVVTNDEGTETSLPAILSVIPAGEGLGWVTAEYWYNINGNDVAFFTSSPKYPNNPDFAENIDIFQIPDQPIAGYGKRVHGYVHPPTTGDYIFYISADDKAELWLSSTESPADITQIADVFRWAAFSEYDKYDGQNSASISLKAGQKYYISALHKDGGGPDHLQVAWKGPDLPFQVIKANYLSPFDVGLSVDNNLDASQIKVYPNPFNDELIIQPSFSINNSQIKVELYSLIGAKLTESTFRSTESNESINLNLNTYQLSDGVYILKVSLGDKFFYKRVIKDQ